MILGDDIGYKFIYYMINKNKFNNIKVILIYRDNLLESGYIVVVILIYVYEVFIWVKICGFI